MGTLSKFSIVLFSLCLIVWGGFRIVSRVSFDRACEGHLKRAADANSIELAEKELQTAVSWLEANKMTDGYTSAVYNTPDEDVGFWYQNLKQSLSKLQAFPAEKRGDQLTESNVLIKLRETLTDPGSSGGIVVTSPKGISIYPDNKAWYWFMVISTAFSSILFLIGWVTSDHRSRNYPWET